MKLLIFKVNQLGDNVIFLPNLQDLLRRFPSWEIHLLTSGSAAAIYDGLLPPEQIHIYNTSEFNRCWKRPYVLLKEIISMRRLKADACIIAEDQGNVAHLLAMLCGGLLRVGAKRPFVKFRGSYTSRVDLPEGKHLPWWSWLMRRRLLEELGEDPGPEAPAPPDMSHLVDALPNERLQPFAMIHPGGSLPYKRWHPERFAELANRLSDRVHMVWVAHDIEPPATLASKVEVFRPGSLREYVSRLSRATLQVVNHSGPLHLANVLGVSVVAISGPSHYVWDPIWYEDKVRILREESLSCLPCDPFRSPRGYCINQEQPLACMDAWSVDAVEKHCAEFLKISASIA